MQAAEFICVWFAEQQHAMLFDRRSFNPSPVVPSSSTECPGWRVVGIGSSRTDGSGDVQRETNISVWPPLYPIDLPFLIGPDHALRQIDVFDFSPSPRVPTQPLVATQFYLDPSLEVSRADGWYVLPCHDPEHHSEGALFGQAVFIGRHVFAADPIPNLIDEIITQAATGKSASARAAGYVVVPIAGKNVGPAVFGQHRPSNLDVTVDVVLQPRIDGTLQPVIELTSLGGVPLDNAIESFRYCVFRRNARSFDLPDFAYSRPLSSSDSRLSHQLQFSLPEPIFHGDVIGIVSRGLALRFSPRLGAGIGRSIETNETWQIALLVRQEECLIAATDDLALCSSGRLDELRETIAAEAVDMAINGLLQSLKTHLASTMMRTAVATSYLIDHALALRARAELTDLLMGERIVHLEHIAFAVASPLRLEQLVATGRPLDEPWRRQTHGIDQSVLGSCVIDIAELGTQAGNESALHVLQAALRDGLAVQAVINVSTRTPAIAHWKSATSV